VIVKKKILASLMTSALAVVVLAANLTAHTVPTAPAENLSYLPASDAVMLIDARRLLNEAMPSILAGDPAKVAQASAEIDKFKARTGIDPRSFDRVVVGSRFTFPSAGVTKLETVAIAHGTFDAKSVAANVRAAAKGKYREEQYHGATIMIVPVNEELKVLGLWNMQVNDLAICVLDSNSLALGTPPNVRAAITAGKQGGNNTELSALASRDPGAVIGFGANLRRELLANLNVGNDTIAKDVNSIRQVYGAIGSKQSDVSLTVVARTDSAESAQNLSDTITGLRQLGGFVVARMAEPRKTLAQSALDNLKVTTRGVELEIRTQVAAANLASLIK
jgi:hypothetical protein